MLHVGEAHFLQGPGAAAAVLEVHLLQGLGGDLLELCVAGVGVLDVEEPGGVDGGQGDGQVPDAVLVRWQRWLSCGAVGQPGYESGSKAVARRGKG